ncbi:lasso peptide biosynthesis B2 protein [Sphingomonas sp.]|jgi:hypothetical protein|uniref:lasso peptide biosynthesis B2 protein n=1 Tax=Sphingomonas sp. TaxID=28214 RepID=UPI002E33C087|nr:lasso peptide biosynthesis B2 protein [Sphingomonas sp.]HEX4693592.1 lasso peptide biosynthesis B2 protein [Sphingomonas sp.]
MPLQLRSGLSFCRVGERLVFLDVPGDRYFCLATPLERAIARMADDAADADPADDAVARLIERGILVASGHPVVPCDLSLDPADSLLDGGAIAETGAAIRAAANLWASIVRVKRRSLRHNLRAIALRRRAADPPQARSLAQIAAAFDRASGWTSSHDRCLPQSLAVARAALSAGHDVRVVLGVSLGPFFAHCWVQQGATVVNDRVDLVRRFTPILVV